MEIEIPMKTPTVNHLYGQRGFQKYLTKEAKEIRKTILKLLEGKINDLDNKRLEVKVYIVENWLTKKNELKRKDVSNREKFLIDSVFQGLGLDDKFIVKEEMIKVQSKDKELARIVINEKEILEEDQ